MAPSKNNPGPARRSRRPRLAPHTLSLPRRGVGVAMVATAATAEDDPAPPTWEEPVLPVNEIQGNVLPGFNTSRLTLIGLRIGTGADDARQARRWLREISPLVTTLAQAYHARELRRAVAMATEVRPDQADVFLNVALSFDAFALLGLDDAPMRGGVFAAGMPAADLQDARDAMGVPFGWKMGATPATTPHLLLMLGSDTAPAMDHAVATLLAHTGPGTGLTVIYRDGGERLTDEREHFGFRDGISQPGVRGRISAHPESFLTRRYLAADDPLAARFSRPGEPLLWPGQFVLGFPTDLEDGSPGDVAAPPAPWMNHGSFLVFRRLQQDVAAFRQFAAAQAAAVTGPLGEPVSPELAQAWIVGRWPDGQPLMRCPVQPPPGVPPPDDSENNHFDYGSTVPPVTVEVDGGSRVVPGVPGDDAGLRCPRFAHIRKVNLRDKLTDQGPSFHFRLLRRGIPYGAPWQEGEPAGIDRGLLFLSYEKDFELNAFRVLSTNWMNKADAPEADSGNDLLVGQNRAGRKALRTVASGASATLAAGPADLWIRATGGGFFFSPAVSVLARLPDKIAGAGTP